jgi:hypothetical protein
VAVPAVKLTVAAEGAMLTESVESFAVKVADPTVVDLTVNVAIPELLVVAETAVMVSAAPREELTVIAFPETKFE